MINDSKYARKSVALIKISIHNRWMRLTTALTTTRQVEVIKPELIRSCMKEFAVTVVRECGAEIRDKCCRCLFFVLNKKTARGRNCKLSIFHKMLIYDYIYKCVWL